MEAAISYLAIGIGEAWCRFVALVGLEQAYCPQGTAVLERHAHGRLGHCGEPPPEEVPSLTRHTGDSGYHFRALPPSPRRGPRHWLPVTGIAPALQPKGLTEQLR